MPVIEMSAPLITDRLSSDESLSFSGSYRTCCRLMTKPCLALALSSVQDAIKTKAEMSLGSLHDKVSVF